MATKCITITLEAYERLASKKEKNESFSNVITRIIPPPSLKGLYALAGLLTDKEAEELKKYRKEIGKEMEKGFSKTIRAMQRWS